MRWIPWAQCAQFVYLDWLRISTHNVRKIVIVFEFHCTLILACLLYLLILPEMICKQ